MIILGVDPGISKTGFGLIKIKNGKASLLDFGVVTTTTRSSTATRLRVIYDKIFSVLKKNSSCQVAVEEVFYGKNFQSALQVGQARGVVLLAASHLKIPVWEYSTRAVKQSVVGLGNASKKQIEYMVKTLLNCSKKSLPEDAADALAVALCHYQKLNHKLK